VTTGLQSDDETGLVLAKSLRGLSDEGLAQYLAGWREGTGNWWLAQMEFKRRQEAGNVRRGWLGIALSVLALLVSLVGMIPGGR
jgi:hypothetical protein